MNSIGSTEVSHAYPRLHVLPNGNILCSTPMDSPPPRRNTILINPEIGSEIVVCPCPLDGTYDRWDTTSILLPLFPDDYRPRILICGSEKPMIIDMSSANPRWEATSPRTLSNISKRYELNSVILPTGEVFIFGGIVPIFNPDVRLPDINGVQEAELYDPISNEWKTLSAASVVRNYHSVGLLMPDGRVWTAGSSKEAAPGPDFREHRIEIFEPWYYFVDRPKILSHPFAVDFDQKFTVEINGTGEITRVAIIHPGSVTHCFNSDQRYIGLKFERENVSNSINVSAPPKGVCVPGFYLLFIINHEGVPCEGKFIRIGSGPGS